MAGAICPLCDAAVDGPLCPRDGVPPFRPGAARPREVGIGQVIASRYRLEEPLGQGTMGQVYRATQLGMQRSVALKVLKTDLISELKLVKRFYREARAVSDLSHPNVVRVFDFGVDDGLPFLVFEHVKGETLRALLSRERRLSEARALSLLAQVARGLIAAHALGLIHRDLKPENLMIEQLPGGAEHVRILDFGVVKMELGQALTDAGRLIGTPHYMSPEQILGEELDGRSDLYALGCILHELISGTPPYDERTVPAILRAHHRSEIPPLPGASAEVDRLRRSLLAKDRRDRPASAENVAIALECTPAVPSVPAPPPPRRTYAVAIALALVVLFGTLAFVLFSAPEEPAPVLEEDETVPFAMPKADTVEMPPPAPAPEPPKEPAPKTTKTKKKKKKRRIAIW